MNLDKEQLETLTKIKKQAEEFLVSHQETLVAVAEKVRLVMTSPIIEQIATAQKAVADFFERNQETLRQIAQTAVLIGRHQALCDKITDNGWPISPAFPLHEIIESKTEEPTYIDGLVITHFDEANHKNLDLLFTTAKKNVNDGRAAILDEIHDCYTSERYYACICLGLTQLEGISADFLREAASKDDQLKQELHRKNILKKGPTKKREKKVKTALELSLEDWLETGLIDFIAVANTLDLVNHGVFGSNNPTSIALKAVNILHGHSTDFGTKKNALITILLLDLISHVSLTTREK
jgi:hypothetical protein